MYYVSCATHYSCYSNIVEKWVCEYTAITPQMSRCQEDRTAMKKLICVTCNGNTVTDRWMLLHITDTFLMPNVICNLADV